MNRLCLGGRDAEQLLPALDLGDCRPRLSLSLSTTVSAGEIHEASIDGDSERVRQLLEQDDDVDAPDDAGTPLQWALFGNQTEVVALLLEHGADPNIDNDNPIPLVQAATKGNAEIAQLLLEAGADPNRGDAYTPLTAVAQTGNSEITDLLITFGGDLSLTATEGLTPLHVAAKGGHLEVAKILLANGADVNALTARGKPAIHFAAAFEQDAMARFLEYNGAASGPIEPIKPFLATADLERGEAAAAGCFWCHPVNRPVSGQLGPFLWDIVNRKRGGLEGYGYSNSIANLDGDWSYEALNQFIARPFEIVPGTFMDFDGTPDPQTRADIILYLRTLSDDPAPLP